MHFLELTLPILAENLALDEALLLEAEAGRSPEVLRLWEWPTPAVVLGSGGRLAEDVTETACRADGVPIGRRSSGGGTVLLGKGCLCFSLVLACGRGDALRDIRPSYCYILNRIRNALNELTDGVEIAGTSDLTKGGRKFSGNSQQRKREHLLHHGTILYDFAANHVSKYLKEPSRQPDYRENRTHAEFMTNLGLERTTLANCIRSAWAADELLAEWPAALVNELEQEKYGTVEWTRRR